MADPREEDLEARILDRFRRAYLAAAPFQEDRNLAKELVLEARATVEALVRESGDADRRGPPAESRDDQAARHREGLTLVALLSRWAGRRGATPVAAAGMVEALAEGFAHLGCPLAPSVLPLLRHASIEGYVAGRDDRFETDLRSRLVGTQATLTVVPGCLALVLAGDLEPDVLEQAVDRFGRELHRADAKACLIHLGRLQNPSPSRAAEVFGADVFARMLGARCVFVEVPDVWREALTATRMEAGLLSFAPTFEAGLLRVLPLAGRELRRSRPGLFRRR